MPSPSPTDDENPPRRDPGNSTFTHNPFHFHHTTTTALYPVHPQHHHHPQPRWDTTTTQSTSSAPDTVPTYDSAVHTSRLTGYHPLGTWNVPFPAMGSHTGEVYYPTAYNVVDPFPIVQPARGHALHPYPHAYSNASHQMAPSPSRHQRRDIYGGMHENEAAAPQAGQRHYQRTDPEQSNPQSIIHQRTQELLGQTTLSSSLSADRHDATTEYRVASGGGGVAMLGGGENEAGSSSTVHVGPDHVGLPFLLGSVGGPFYGVPPSIGDVMGKPNTGAVTGTTSTTAHVGDMPNSRISQGPISASTSALEHHPHNLVAESRVPSTRPSSPMGRFVRCTSPHENIQAPAVTDGGPDSGSGGSLQTHPQSHVESQSSHSHSHSQNLHINPQSSHAQPYIHTHPSSYIHPRSHSSLSPASYGSYPTTGEHSTTGSSTSEYPTTTPSLDGYPTGGGYPPSASLVEQYPHPTTTTTTGCWVDEYPGVTVEERSASAPESTSGSLSRQTDGNAETTTTTRGGYGAGYGHGHSESLSTVRGSMTSSQHYREYESSSYPMSIAPPPPTVSRPDNKQGGGGQTHRRDPGPHLCQPGSASAPGAVRPTFLQGGGAHGQTQQRGGRRVHQYPNPARRVRGDRRQREQGSQSSSSYPRGASMTRSNVSVQGEKSRGQSLGGGGDNATMGGATAKTGKRARRPKRLRAVLMDNAPAIAVPTEGGGGGGDSDDDSDGDDEEGDDGHGDGEPLTGPGGSGPGSRGGPEVGGGREQGNTGGGGGIGPRKAGACVHCKRLKMKCEFPGDATSCTRCTKSGYACIVEGRRKKLIPNKREYLLAQIRHKDQIIESLLKQLHDPYMATPLSISAFKLATSPSDKDNVKIADWMDRLQTSTKPPSQPCPSRMEMLRELRESRNNAGGGGGGDNNIMEESDEMEEGNEITEGEETEKLRSALPDAAVPIGLLANLSLDKDKDKGKGRTRQDTGSTSTNTKAEDDDDNVGVANKEYFMPGPANNLSIRKNLIEQHSPPDILLHGLVTAADVEKLFEIFWSRINPFISLLDRKIHSPTAVFQRCPFLFTVICAISSRYYDKSEIYPVAMHFAKHAAANALIDGWKSVELCQAYILMSIYTVPARRWEEDRSWLYTGLAIRIATDLNLHQAFDIQPTTEKQERELLNRIRVWMICFNLDRSTATQFGKPSTIKEDHITRNAVTWYKNSLYNDKYDIHLCGYTMLLRIVAQFHDDVFSDPDSPTGLNRSIDFLSVTLEHDNRLTLYFEEWTNRFNEESDHSDPGSAFRCKLLPFLVNYSRLVMYSFGFQHAFQRGMESNDQVFLQKCFRAATAVIEHMTEVLAPSGFMQSSPDGHFVFASFASAFLLKLLRPEFAQFLTRKMEDEIFESISRLITTLQELAIDERHTPHLYARFLAGLLAKHRKGGAGIGGHLQSRPPPSQSVHKPPTQPRRSGQQYLSSPSSLQYSGLSQDSSHLRYDSDAMQMNGGPFSGTSGSPPPATTPPMPAASTLGPEYLAQPSLPLGVGSADVADVGMDDILPDIGALASMRALNDVWWGNMMMPGFTWPDVPLMSSLHDGLPSAHQPAFPAFSAPETRVAM